MTKKETEALIAIKDYCIHLQYHSKNLTQKQYVGNSLVMYIILDILNDVDKNELERDIKELNTLDLSRR